jgi:hypothetical protein
VPPKYPPEAFFLCFGIHPLHLGFHLGINLAEFIPDLLPALLTDHPIFLKVATKFFLLQHVPMYVSAEASSSFENELESVTEMFCVSSSEDETGTVDVDIVWWIRL